MENQIQIPKQDTSLTKNKQFTNKQLWHFMAIGGSSMKLARPPFFIA